MPDRYHSVAIWLHWLIAAAIIINLADGMIMHSDLVGPAQKMALYQWHKSLGIVILLLSLARLAWRLTHSAPPLPETVKPWEKKAAQLTHGFLYAFMIVIPLSGWLMVSASPKNIPTILFGIIPWPHLPMDFVDDRKAAAHFLSETHELLAYTLIALLAGHIGAACKHYFINRDGVMQRMLPRLRTR